MSSTDQIRLARLTELRSKRAAKMPTEREYDALKKGQRIWLGVTTSWADTKGEAEFEVGRKTYSNKYDVYSLRLLPIIDGKPHTGGAKWTLFKRAEGFISLGHGGMGTVVKSFRMASTDMTRLAQLRRLRTLRAAANQKTAGSFASDMLFGIIDRKGLIEVQRVMKKAGDEQSVKLLREIQMKLINTLLLSFDRGAEEAINRLTGLANRVKSWDPALIRNNIFKAANSLGINLPSGMFASTKVAAEDAKWFKGEINKALQILEDACDVVEAPGGIAQDDGKVQGAVNDIRKNISRDLAKHVKAIR